MYLCNTRTSSPYSAVALPPQSHRVSSRGSFLPRPAPCKSDSRSGAPPRSSGACGTTQRVASSVCPSARGAHRSGGATKATKAESETTMSAYVLRLGFQCVCIFVLERLTRCFPNLYERVQTRLKHTCGFQSTIFFFFWAFFTFSMVFSAF